jgi:hypothetical protein
MNWRRSAAWDPDICPCTPSQAGVVGLRPNDNLVPDLGCDSRVIYILADSLLIARNRAAVGAGDNDQACNNGDQCGFQVCDKDPLNWEQLDGSRSTVSMWRGAFGALKHAGRLNLKPLRAPFCAEFLGYVMRIKYIPIPIRDCCRALRATGIRNDRSAKSKPRTTRS